MRGVNARRGDVAAGAVSTTAVSTTAVVAVAVAVAAGGCTPIGDQVTHAGESEASAAPAGPVNPWTLPLEQRPPLYDACTELPPSALDSAGIPSANQIPDVRVTNPGIKMTCALANSEAIIGFTSTWESIMELQKNSAYRVQRRIMLAGRNVFVVDEGDSNNDFCAFALFTHRAKVTLRLGLTTSLKSFNGKRFTEPCSDLESVSSTIIPLLPAGDFA